MDPHIAAFVGVAALLTLMPGPDMALVTRNVLRGGRRVALPSALGVAAGCLAWGVGSSLGIAALVAASAEAYTVLRLAGAAYLTVLGLLALRSAMRPTTTPADNGADAATPAMLSRTAAFRVCMLNNLVNPKVGMFYVTFLPQFIPPGTPVFAMSVMLAGIHAAMGVVWFTVYGSAISQLGTALRTGRVRRGLEAATGLALLGFGLRIAIER